MLISYHWLKQFTDLKKTPEELADRITLNLVEVENLLKRGDDTILEIENKGITNRPDCFSQLGLAREAAAYFKTQFNDPLEKLLEKKFKAITKIPLTVEVKEPNLCYRYSSIVLTDVKVGPSPEWLKSGVENCGVRSINNVVDVTNYVMLELGQPIHAFDYELLSGKNIIVRLAKKGEQIKTLDGEIRKLSEKILVIADAEEPVAIAGIMGGAKAEISNNTQSIVLESANFDKTNNRQAEKALKLRTDASTRFEKGLDVNRTLPALNRAVELLQKVAEAKVASMTIDKQFKKVTPWQIIISPPWINKFLGLKLTIKEMTAILNQLQLKTQLKNKKIVVTIPTYRQDLRMPADLAEEIARIYGYDNIPITPLATPLTLPKVNPTIKLRKKVKNFLSASGFSEILSPPFLGRATLEQFQLNPKKHLKLINPLTIEQEYLRRSLIPNLTLTAKNNLRFFNKLKLFEINRIFIPKGDKQPEEIEKLSALIVDDKSYLKLKGALESLLSSLGISARFKPLKKEQSFWQVEQTTEVITQEKENLGKLGKIKSSLLQQIEIEKDLSVFTLNFTKLVKLSNLTKRYQSIPSNPPIIEDLTFVIKPGLYIENLIQLIKECSLIIQTVELIDSYKDSRTLRVTYQHPKRNLTDKEVKEIRKKVIGKVEKQTKARLKN